MNSKAIDIAPGGSRRTGSTRTKQSLQTEPKR
jgi:hypothetical protein